VSFVTTSIQEHQEYIDLVNHLFERLAGFEMARHQKEPFPDFSRVRLYLGQRERRALNLVEHCTSFKSDPGKGSWFQGYPVFFVQLESHIALVEVQH